MDPAECAAREAIRDLVARYNALGDAGRLDALVALFAEDGELEVEGRRHRGRAALRALFESAAAEARAGQGVRHLRHFTATHVVDLEEGERARGRCYFLVLTDAGVDHWGRYEDLYGRVGGRWHFVRRRVRVDGQVPGGWAERTLPRTRRAGEA
jgi:ketosteroid isomerase-like protein